uniref:Uncharacterized protein n=2 Tax=Prorocentrum micans TaxID=2945 RepID=A0A7S2X5B3_PROMC|mmetsp:Transcript_12691/g.10154  ORF Transcript_12691/g.10154 Transcript_12691/m.10154 type:complete len:109 (+) Transcript_12691:107-433(+)
MQYQEQLSRLLPASQLHRRHVQIHLAATSSAGLTAYELLRPVAPRAPCGGEHHAALALHDCLQRLHGLSRGGWHAVEPIFEALSLCQAPHPALTKVRRLPKVPYDTAR